MKNTNYAMSIKSVAKTMARIIKCLEEHQNLKSKLLLDCVGGNNRTTMQWIKILEEHGIIEAKYIKPAVLYRLKPYTKEELIEIFLKYAESWFRYWFEQYYNGEKDETPEGFKNPHGESLKR